MAEEETTPETQEVTEEAKTTEPTEEYKAIQRTLAKEQETRKKLESELENLKLQQPSREIAETLVRLTEQLGELSENDAELGKRLEAVETGGEYKPAPSPTREARRQRQLADEMLAEHGFSPLDPRFRDARKGDDPARAVNRRIREVYQEEKAKGKEDIDRIVDERVAEKWQQHLKDHAGEFKLEGGGPSGGVGDEQQWLNDFAAGKIPSTPENRKKAEKFIGNLSGGFGK